MYAPVEDADVLTSSESYALRFAGPVGAWLLEGQARTTLELIAPFAGGSVLDVGGGHGQLVGPLVESGFPVTVFGSHDSCRERLRGFLEAGRAKFEAGELLCLPFADGAFDVAVSYRLLPHVARWPALVAELSRVARRAVLVDYPTKRSVNALAGPLFEAKKRVEGDTRRFRVFREREIEEAFAGVGFRPTGRRPQFFWPMALHRALGMASASRALEAAASGLGLRRAFGSPVILRLERRG